MGKSKKAKLKKGAPEQLLEVESTAVEMESQETPITTRKARKAAAPKPSREERNGVKRPGPGKCLEVWVYLDKHGDMKATDMKPIALEKGWNVNNALIELYQWRRFHSVTRTATTPEGGVDMGQNVNGEAMTTGKSKKVMTP